ncbi:MAG: 2-C-methyl-D-erythritol 4-phosphate cytidylyltransferase [Candidatus Omnitrophica bacterium]|nr:2-C-methyl-D-erythritol 4-phosphate cytidylyltransferase [Candidatus Omnitrophota bacterium]
MNLGVVIVSAGIGTRLGKRDKPILKLGSKPLFSHSLEVFKSLKQVKQIVLVLRKSHFRLARKFIQDGRVILVEGGARRRDSVYNGLLALDGGIDSVLVHDGARPLISRELVIKVIKALKINPAVILGVKATDTLKLTKGKIIKKTVKRDDFYCAQTPQGFRKDLIVEAYKKFKSKAITDSAQAVELLGKRVKIVEGDRYNIKITYPQDIALAEAIYRLKR